jgi:hypothetical protein
LDATTNGRLPLAEAAKNAKIWRLRYGTQVVFMPFQKAAGFDYDYDYDNDNESKHGATGTGTGPTCMFPGLRKRQILECGDKSPMRRHRCAAPLCHAMTRLDASSCRGISSNTRCRAQGRNRHDLRLRLRQRQRCQVTHPVPAKPGLPLPGRGPSSCMPLWRR